MSTAGRSTDKLHESAARMASLGRRGLSSILAEAGQPEPTECIIDDAERGVMDVIARAGVPIGGEMGYNLWFSQTGRTSEKRAVIGISDGSRRSLMPGLSFPPTARRPGIFRRLG